MDHIKVGHRSAGKRTLEGYCDFSDQHFMVQRGARTETHQGYFSYFTKPWSRLGLQFRPLLWSWKSSPSNYTVLPRDDVKMITVHCMSFPPHQSPRPEPTGTCPSYKQQFNTFLSIHSENNIISEHDLHFSVFFIYNNLCRDRRSNLRVDLVVLFKKFYSWTDYEMQHDKGQMMLL